MEAWEETSSWAVSQASPFNLSPMVRSVARTCILMRNTDLVRLGEAGEAAQSGCLFDYLRKGMSNARIGARDDCGRHVKLKVESCILVSMSMSIKVVIYCI